jgi:uncharacterized protein YggE
MSRETGNIGHHIGDTPEKNKISVTGEHTSRSAPDTASISLVIESELPRADDASGLTLTVYEAVVTNGIMKTFEGQLVIEVNGFTVGPVWLRQRDQKPRITGYKAVRSVTLVTRDLEIIGRVLGVASFKADEVNGANNLRVNGVSFSLRENKKIELETLEKATTNAMEKIKVIAKASDVQSWVVAKIIEGGSSRPRQIHFESARSLSADSSPGPREATMTMAPGVIETRKIVEVTVFI